MRGTGTAEAVRGGPRDNDGGIGCPGGAAPFAPALAPHRCSLRTPPEEIVMPPQGSPASHGWIAAVYDSLREPEKAAKLREEMANTGSKTVKSGRGN